MRVNRVIKILVTSDLLILAAFGFMTPIFAVFITGQIEGGTIQVVGLAAAIYLIVKSSIQIPVGRRLDKVRGEKDDFYLLIFGSILVSLVPFGFIFSSLPWHIYLLEIILGIGDGLVIPSWGGFFTRHIDKGQEAFEWSLESTVVGFGVGITAAVGGYLANKFGFNLIFVIVGIMSLIGSLFLIFLYKTLKPRVKDHRGEVTKIRKVVK